MYANFHDFQTRDKAENLRLEAESKQLLELARNLTVTNNEEFHAALNLSKRMQIWVRENNYVDNFLRNVPPQAVFESIPEIKQIQGDFDPLIVLFTMLSYINSRELTIETEDDAIKWKIDIALKSLIAQQAIASLISTFAVTGVDWNNMTRDLQLACCIGNEPDAARRRIGFSLPLIYNAIINQRSKPVPAATNNITTNHSSQASRSWRDDAVGLAPQLETFCEQVEKFGQECPDAFEIKAFNLKAAIERADLKVPGEGREPAQILSDHKKAHCNFIKKWLDVKSKRGVVRLLKTPKAR